MKRQKLVVAWSCACWLLLAQASHAADHARYLPKEPGGTPGEWVWNNVGGPNGTEVDFDVKQGTAKVGVLKFSYDTYVDVPKPGDTFFDGGAGMAGGFTMADGFMLKPDFSLSFVQTVIATKSGNNEWEAPDGTAFPDSMDPKNVRAERSTPEYAQQFLFDDLMANGAGLDPKFSDVALRRFKDGAQTWRAELGLAAVNAKSKEVRVIANVAWGFDMWVAPTEQITDVKPTLLAAPTAQYMDTLTKYFDNVADNQPGKASAVVWTFNRMNAFMAVPEPGAGWLAALASAALGMRRRAAPGRRGSIATRS